LKKPGKSNGAAAAEICRACGLCCNGVIFGDVKLQPGDAPARLQALRLSLPQPVRRQNAAPEAAPGPLVLWSHKPRISQPCAGYDGCRCRLYAERPRYCREFECALLTRVKAGQMGSNEALRLIRSARQGAAEVTRLLRRLGDTDEQVALAKRFRGATRRIEKASLDPATAAAYGKLSLAMHKLNRVLSRDFYPGPAARQFNMSKNRT
jgi:hypothetical protein